MSRCGCACSRRCCLGSPTSDTGEWPLGCWRRVCPHEPIEIADFPRHNLSRPFELSFPATRELHARVRAISVLSYPAITRDASDDIAGLPQLQVHDVTPA